MQQENHQTYISETEHYIVKQRQYGRSFVDLASELGIPAAEIERQCVQAFQKAQSLCGYPINNFMDTVIEDFLESIGIHRIMIGGPEIAAAIALAMEDPTLLDFLRDKLYPAVAQRLGLKSATVNSHVLSALRAAVQNKASSEQGADFFQRMNVNNYRELRARNFFDAAISDIQAKVGSI